MEANVPKRIQRSKKHNMYLNNEVTRMKNKKQKLWKKYVASKSAEGHEKFVRCKNNLRSLTRTLRKNVEKAIEDKIKNSPKPFWSYVQSKLKTKVKIPTLTKSDGTNAYNSSEKAEVLNEYFVSVYQDEYNNIPPATKIYSGIPLVSTLLYHLCLLCYTTCVYSGICVYSAIPLYRRQCPSFSRNISVLSSVTLVTEKEDAMKTEMSYLIEKRILNSKL